LSKFVAFDLDQLRSQIAFGFWEKIAVGRVSIATPGPIDLPAW